MANTLEYNDLCITCNHGPTCVRREHHGKPVWYCEEFDDYQPPPKGPVGLTAKEELAKESAMSEKISDLLPGLCCNCENNEICMIPKSEGGVWHCEEYR
jgi:hypothetical protein